MRYLLSDGSYVGQGTAFTFNDIQYPANWLDLATDSDKETIGAQLVVAVNERLDDRYYVVTEEVVGAELTYTNTPKDLRSLKVQATEKINDSIYANLKTSDYIMVRNYQDATYKPEWITWRDSVLSTGRTAKDEIAAATDVEALIAVTWTIPHNPDYVAPTETANV